jgi:hypothetical protein
MKFPDPLKVLWALQSPVDTYSQIEGSVQLEDGTGELLVIYASGSLTVLVNGQVRMSALLAMTGSNFMDLPEILKRTSQVLDWSKWEIIDGIVSPKTPSVGLLKPYADKSYLEELMKLPFDQRKKLMNGEWKK